MSPILSEVLKLIERPEISEPAKNCLETLTEGYGWKWWWELSEAESPKVPGFSGLASEILPTPESPEQTVSFSSADAKQRN